MTEDIRKPNDNALIRSQEMNDLLGTPPVKIIRNGISVLSVFFGLIILSSFIIKYPEIIKAKITISSENPPIDLYTKTEGNIKTILVADNQPVDSSQVLLILENPSSFQSVCKIEGQLITAKNMLIKKDEIQLHQLAFKRHTAGGQLEQVYAHFHSAISEVRSFLEMGYYEKKIAALMKEVEYQEMYFKSKVQESKIFARDYKLSTETYQRQEKEYQIGGISQSSLDEAKSILLEKEIRKKEAETALASAQISIAENKQEILDLQLQASKELKKLYIQLAQSIQEVRGEIDIWKEKYIISAPKEGKISLNKIWTEGQYLSKGDHVLSLLSKTQNGLLGILELPAKKSGKVQPKQKVQILLDGYPHMEFGKLNAEIKKISSTPDINNQYLVEIMIADTLLTNYGIQIPFKEKMTGEAEIITENVNVIERIFSPLRSIIKNNISYRNSY